MCYEQLWGAVGAVFSSWQNERATLYRQKYNIPAEWGTAVNVQAMVFGNSGDNSATGVAFTRDPPTAKRSSTANTSSTPRARTSSPASARPRQSPGSRRKCPRPTPSWKRSAPASESTSRTCRTSSSPSKTANSTCCRPATASAPASPPSGSPWNWSRSASSTKKTALLKIPADSISSLLVAVFDPAAEKKAKLLATGLPAGPGAAAGKICFTAEKAEEVAKAGGRAVLCRVETTPEDLRGMIAAEGILTSRGGVSSHAALVARQMNKVCVCGASGVVINYGAGRSASDQTLSEGDDISINGTTGEIYAGHVATAPSEVDQVLNGKLKAKDSYTYQLFDQVMTWADKHRKLGVRTNADTPDQSEAAVAFGAEGIGLCRTEHMFFEGDRITYMRQMILASDEKERRAALKKLLPFQRKDFTGLFKAMGGRPVTVRLLDPPLHEFLPHDESSKRELANSLGVDVDVISNRVHALHEANPMLGHRGCRLGISYPEITEMQARAIFEAAAACYKLKKPIKVIPEVMIPLVGFADELKHQAASSTAWPPRSWRRRRSSSSISSAR